MALALQWLLTIAGLFAGLIAKRICQRYGVPPLPWRTPWIALLAHTTEQSVETFQIPISAGLDLSLITGIFSSIAISRCLIWLILEILPSLRILPSSPKILRDLIFIVGSLVLIALNLKEQASIDLVGLVTTSAVLTAVVGLAAQDPLKDLIGGLSLQLEQVIREGDWVEIEGHIGRVQSISWRDTEITSLYGSKLIFPHTNSNSGTIRNFTSNGAHGNRLLIGLDYSMPPDRAKAIMQKISDNHPLVLRSPTSIIRISTFEESCINYEWVNWQKDYGQSRTLRGDLQEQLWYALQREGFSFPFSVRDVRITKNIQQAKTNTSNKDSLLQTIQHLLKNNQLFSILSEEQLKKVITMSSFCSYGPGEIIVNENETGDSLFMLINGNVSIRKPANSHEYLEIAQLQRGDIFGEMTVFTGAPRSATIHSISKVDLLEVKREAIADLLEEEPGLIERFGQLISDRQAQLAQLTIQSVPPSSRDVMGRMKKLFKTLLS
jgi:small-conductance mechanosensitive channel/CRP-like cAMP-binding protein